uniref:Uncharacterized protein n=1 Tax=Anguilla anguilla TaxID=7936 RepID=A0A0E9PVA8_ANGAN
MMWLPHTTYSCDVRCLYKYISIPECPSFFKVF